MKNQTERQSIITLDPSELCLFQYFLGMNRLPVKIARKYLQSATALQLSLRVSHPCDPIIINQLWQEWKQEELEAYAALN